MTYTYEVVPGKADVYYSESNLTTSRSVAGNSF
jgi:hypothetical protein